MGTARSNKNRKTGKAVCLFIMAISLFFGLPANAAPKQTLSEKFNIEKPVTNTDFDKILFSSDKYSDELSKYNESGLAYAGSEISLSPDAAVCSSDGAAAPVEGYEGYDGPAVIWKNNTSYEWTFDVQEDGLYEIAIDYYPLEGDISDIQRAIYIDGEIPFDEARNIVLRRSFAEEGRPFTDQNGDEKAPRLRQQHGWFTTDVYDLNGAYPEPLLFHFTRGEHKLKLLYVSGTIALGRVRLTPPASIPSYDEVKEEYISGQYAVYSGLPVRKQGEEAELRSRQILRRTYSSDPCTDPYEYGAIRQNTIGGWYWRTGNDTVTWKMDVPEDGLYMLSARILQDYENGLTVYRQIIIDGKVPFKEFNAYPFAFNSKWRTVEIGGDEPYLLWLTKGSHEITMKVVTGEYTPILEELNDINLSLSKVIRDIMAITGPQPDLNFQYELDKKIPWIMDELKGIRDALAVQSGELLKLSGSRQPIVNSLLSASQDIDELVGSPDRIPAKLNDLANLQTSISSWYSTLQQMPLSVDYIELLAPGDAVKNPQTTVWQMIKVTWLNFIRSFTKNYEGISLSPDDTDEEAMEEIDVWIARGREWGELLKLMADDDFMPEYNIKVNVNILPSGSVGAIGGVSPLMLSLVTGNAPDVAVGSDQSTPVELAIRDAAEDLSKYEGFDGIIDDFEPGAVVPFEYKGGTYALPETMDLNILLYRTDIADTIHMQLPNTWEELYSKTLPVVKQNGFNFFMTSDYSIFLFQNGGSYYSDDGLKTALDSDSAYRAFLQWTRNYTVYRMEASADLFNHFRVGDIPVAVGTLQDYIKLSVAAPELYGRWSIAPIPGTMDENSNINRSAPGTITSSMMFSQSENKEAAWKFMKWWSSAETQQRYASEIEALMGPEARWFSANINAFESLPWSMDDLQVISESRSWLTNPPNVLGGYITSRHVSNAWTRTVMNNMNPRDSFEQAVKDIKNEMERKQREYGVIR